VTDPIAGVLGDYRAFFAGQKDRLRARGIDISPYSLSHLAYRVPECDQYLHVRGLLERHAAANLENVWNGRPISKILLREPPHVEPHDRRADRADPAGPPTRLQDGLEHVGVVVGDAVEEFARTHRAALTGQQFQGEGNEPYCILFEVFTLVKFYRYSLRAVVEREGGSFDRFVHVDDWVPPVVRTATKGDDPRRTP